VHAIPVGNSNVGDEIQTRSCLSIQCTPVVARRRRAANQTRTHPKATSTRNTNKVATSAPHPGLNAASVPSPSTSQTSQRWTHARTHETALGLPHREQPVYIQLPGLQVLVRMDQNMTPKVEFAHGRTAAIATGFSARHSAKAVRSTAHGTYNEFLMDKGTHRWDTQWDLTGPWTQTRGST
jgi:hypothetical protein